MRGVLRALVIALICAVCTSQRAIAADLRIDFKELAAIASTFLADAKIRLHNAQSGVFDFSAGSSITISGVERPISFKAPTFSVVGVTVAYLINDLNSTAIKISAVDGGVRLAVSFESEGPELVGRCLSGFCPTDVLPEIEWDNAAATIDLVPAKAAQGLTLKAQRIQVQGQITPYCRGKALFGRDLCELALPKARSTLTRYKGTLDELMLQQVNSPAVQEKIADALKAYLKLGKAGEVVISKVSVENGGRAVVVSFCLSCAN